MDIIVYFFIFVIYCLFLLATINNDMNKIEKEDILKYIYLSLINNNVVLNFDKDKILNSSVNDARLYKDHVDETIRITLKYRDILSKEDILRLVNREYFIDMTEEMVKDILGNPTKLFKNKDKFTYIYGVGRGDILIFKQGKLVEFKSR